MSRRETPRGDAYPYLFDALPQPRAATAPAENLNDRSSSGGSVASAPAPAPASGASSASSSSSSSSSSSPPLSSSWFSLQSQQQREETARSSSRQSASTAASSSSSSSSAVSSSASAASATSLPPVPSFAQPRPVSSPSTPPSIYAPQPLRSSPFRSAATVASAAATSALTSAANAIQHALPAPRAANALQSIERWQADQRHRTRRQLAAAVVMTGAPLLLLLLWLLMPLPSSVSLLRWELPLPPWAVSYPLYALCPALLLSGLLALYRFYSPPPSLQGVSQRLRKLHGLPYSETLFAQEMAAAPRREEAAAAAGDAGMRRRNVAGDSRIPAVAAAPAFSTAVDRKPAGFSPSGFAASSPSSAALPAAALQPPAVWPAYGDRAMTDAKELQSFIAEQTSKQQQTQQLQHPPASSQSFYSPYRASSLSYGAGSGSTPPYATSVRSNPTLLRAGSGHHGGGGARLTGRFALDDPRADAESAQRANELFHALGIADAIDLWSRRMQTWMFTVVLQPLARELQSSRQELLALVPQLLNSNLPLREDERQLLRSANLPQQQPLALSVLADRLQGRAEGQRWRQLSRYLRLPDWGQACDGYCLHRLLQLGQADGQAVYSWSAGSDWAGHHWTPALPSDARLLCHTVLSFLSDFYPLLQQAHYADDASLAAAAAVSSSTHHRTARGRANVVMRQCRPHSLPPYFMLLVEEAAGGDAGMEVREWRADPGRSNLFQSFSLLVWFVKHRMDGRLGSIRLKDPALEGLHDVVD